MLPCRGAVMSRAAASGAPHHGMAQAPAHPSALVYCGPGAGVRSALSAMQSLREALVDRLRVDRLTPEQLLASNWQEGCLLLVMPGGADLPYMRLLNGAGNRIIREYVEAGGTYMGLCAGAYYGCARVEFEPGTRLEVVGDRELAFFPGVARGSIYKGFRYESEDGAAAVPLLYRGISESPSAATTGTLGQRRRQLGVGRVVQEPARPGGRDSAQVLMGAAREAGTHATARWAAAAAPAAAPAGTTGTAAAEAAAARPAAAPMAPPEQAASDGQGWRRCEDYVNGGPGFYSWDGSSLLEHPPRGVHVLATYPERGNAAAALLCSVGSGRVVLCGTHPELHPSWLEPCLSEVAGAGAACSDRAARDGGSSGPAAAASALAGEGPPQGGLAALLQEAQQRPNGGGSSAGSTDGSNGDSSQQLNTETPSGDGDVEGAAAAGHLRRLHARLVASQPERWQYWRGLLVAAGLAAWLRPGGR